MTIASLGPDLLEGGAAIAEYLFGDASQCRRVYRLVERGRIPTFRLSGQICARRSILRKFIEDQEARASKGTSHE